MTSSSGDLNGALNYIYDLRNNNNGPRRNDPDLVNADHYLVSANNTKKYGAATAALMANVYEGLKACYFLQTGNAINNIFSAIQGTLFGGRPPYLNYPSPASTDSLLSSLDRIAVVEAGLL